MGLVLWFLLLGKVVFFFCFYGFRGDFYFLIGVCLSGFFELFIFIFLLIGSFKFNVIILVIC